MPSEVYISVLMPFSRYIFTRMTSSNAPIFILELASYESPSVYNPTVESVCGGWGVRVGSGGGGGGLRKICVVRIQFFDLIK